MMDKLRMAEWLGIAVVLFAVLALTAPQQIPIFIYKANLVSFFAFLGYWLSRRLGFRASWSQGSPEYRTDALCKAIIVAASLIAGALAL